MLLPDVLVRLEAEIPPAGAIEKMYGLMLYGAMRKQRPSVVLELGTGKGYSTAWMLLGLIENEHGELWTADITPADNPLWTLLPAPYERLVYLSNDPIATIQEKPPKSIDFIFHDAGHSWPEVKADLEWLLPRLSVNGSIVVHDTSYSKDMGEQLLEYFDSHADEFKYERIEEGCGVGIATRISAPVGAKTEVSQCKDGSSGSTMQKATVSSKVRMVKITSLTTARSKTKKVTKNSKRTNTSSSRLPKNRKAPEPERLVLSDSNSLG